MPRAELNLSRPPDDLPEARVWRPDLLAAADDRRPGQPVQPALFPLPARSTSGRGAFTDLVDLGTLESSARRGRRARGTVVVTVVGPAPGPHLPDVRRWSVSLGVALIEVLLGYRPLAQLLRWLNDDALRVLGVAASGIRDRSAGPGLRERITVVSARVQILGPGRVRSACTPPGAAIGWWSRSGWWTSGTGGCASSSICWARGSAGGVWSTEGQFRRRVSFDGGSVSTEGQGENSSSNPALV